MSAPIDWPITIATPANGMCSFAFPPCPAGQVQQVTINVPNAPPTASMTAYVGSGPGSVGVAGSLDPGGRVLTLVGGVPKGSWSGSTVFGPIEVRPGQQLTVVGIGFASVQGGVVVGVGVIQTAIAIGASYSPDEAPPSAPAVLPSVVGVYVVAAPPGTPSGIFVPTLNADPTENAIPAAFSVLTTGTQLWNDNRRLVRFSAYNKGPDRVWVFEWGGGAYLAAGLGYLLEPGDEFIEDANFGPNAFVQIGAISEVATSTVVVSGVAV